MFHSGFQHYVRRRTRPTLRSRHQLKAVCRPNRTGDKRSIAKISRRLGLAVLLFVISGTAMLMVACSGGTAMSPPATLSVSLSKSTATVDVGTTLNLSANVANDSTNAGVTWTVSGTGALSNQTPTSVTFTGPSSPGSATVTATAVADKSKGASAVVTVNALPMVVAPAQIPPVTVGQPYNLQLTVSAGTGTPPFIWSVAQGQLPKGLTLDSNTGLISGTALSAAVRSGELEASSASRTTTVSTTVQVADSSTPSETGTVNLNFDVSGNASALGFVYVAGDLVISEFSIGKDGTLTLLRPQSQPGSPLARSPGAGDNALIVDPLHRFVYGVDIRGSEVHQYKIAADGTLTEMTPLTVSLGDPSIQATDIVMAPGGGAVYVSSNLGVHQFSVGSDGQLHQLGPPVGPALGTGVGCIAINPSGSLIFTCPSGGGIDSYKLNLDGTVAFLATSSVNAGLLAFDANDSQLIAKTAAVGASGTALATFPVKAGVVGPDASSTGPPDAESMFDISARSGAAYVVAGDLIVPEPPGGGTNDHLSIYDLTSGLVGTPEKRDTGRGPGHVLALASSTPSVPPIPNPLVYVTNSLDNNVAQCVPSTAPSCPTVAISTDDKKPQGITGFLGSPGN